MVESYLKIALRNLSRQKLFSSINILGLAVGLAACILILLYVFYELSYDRYHPKAERTYRVWVEGAVGGNEFELAISSAPMAEALMADYPEVESATRISGIFGFPVIRYGEKVFSEELWSSIDSNATDVFSIPLIQGDPATAWTKPEHVVISESTAKRYFGNENPMGKILNSDKRRDFVVSGVMKDFPPNSHFHYDFLASMASYPQSRNTHWVNNNFYTYLTLREGYDYKDLEAKLPEMVTKYVGPQIEAMMGVSFAKMLKDGAEYKFHLQPLTDIHLKSHFNNEIEVNGNIVYIYIFSLIAIFILLLACINYMNLATARSAKRAKEVGIRKTLGSTRGELIGQFLTESVVFALLAVVVAVLMVKLALPWFNNLIGLQLAFSNSWTLVLLLVAVVIGVLAGSYPAFFLSSFDAAEILVGGQSSRGKGAALRSSLVVFQFTVSIVLFTGALVANQQLSYMQSKPLGFDKTNLLIVEKTDDIGAQILPFKQALLNLPSITSVSNGTSIPGRSNEYSSSVFTIAADEGQQIQLLDMVWVDWDYADTYGIDMVDGRFFDRQFSSDSQSVVINKAAADAYGLDNIIGRDLLVIRGEDGTEKLKIIGIIDDYHYESLHQTVKPLLIIPMGSRMFGFQRTFGKFMVARIEAANQGATLASVESIWKNFTADQAFEYVFQDDDLRALYMDDMRTQAIMSTFTGLAIFIASLGLLGLAAFAAEQRTKEIGIRKVLGATVANIYMILSQEMLRLVLLAIVIALPLSYYLMNRWLEDFAYRISFSPVTFIIAGFVAFVIALGTISYQVLKASLANPIYALKYE